VQVLFLQNVASVRDVFPALATMCDAGKEHAPVGRSVDGYKNGAAQAGKALDITKAGLTQLQSWLTEGDGTSHGAYYVYVKRLAR